MARFCLRSIRLSDIGGSPSPPPVGKDRISQCPLHAKGGGQGGQRNHWHGARWSIPGKDGVGIQSPRNTGAPFSHACETRFGLQQERATELWESYRFVKNSTGNNVKGCSSLDSSAPRLLTGIHGYHMTLPCFCAPRLSPSAHEGYALLWAGCLRRKCGMLLMSHCQNNLHVTYMQLKVKK